ncbi:MAG TPA: two-component system response regulator [Gallionellaceae bacterium]|nr:two-component system response regulator [Gallionellaceae bacterium]
MTVNAAKTVRKVLLIGDDRQLADWAQQTVFASGGAVELTVLSVGTGVLDWLGNVSRKQLPQLILLDLHLPKLDGLAVLRTLRNNVATREIPVVGISTEYTQDDVQMGYKVGANICVAKPATQEEFAALLEQQIAYWLEPRQRELAFASS